MSDIDDFASRLLEESKRFLELAASDESGDGKTAHLHAAILTGFCALEAHVNAIADEFLHSESLSVHETALMSERKVRLQNGEFKISESLEMVRLEDRIQFLHARFSGKPLDRQSTWWSELGAATKRRNNLIHPKAAAPLSQREVELSVQAIVDTINALYQSIYGKPLPVASRGIQSKLTF